MSTANADIIAQLQKEILPLQGFKAHLNGPVIDMGLGPIRHAFPNGIFPTGAIHELLTAAPEHAAATSGFMAGLLSQLMQERGACLWISNNRTLFPPALAAYGIAPERIVFADLKKEKDLLWTMEEALKCEGLSAVVGELKELSFTASRRLQLAVEQSRVTGFVVRQQPRQLQPVACVSRWRITPLASETMAELPGVGYPRWYVELLKIRNGKPGAWPLEWRDNGFHSIQQPIVYELPRQQQWRKRG